LFLSKLHSPTPTSTNPTFIFVTVIIIIALYQLHHHHAKGIWTRKLDFADLLPHFFRRTVKMHISMTPLRRPNSIPLSAFLSLLILLQSKCGAFSTAPQVLRRNLQFLSTTTKRPFPSVLLQMANDENKIGFARSNDNQSNSEDADVAATDDDLTGKKDDEKEGKAATNTINQRLLKELEEAAYKEKNGPRSAAGKKLGLVDGFGRARKTDEEMQAAIEKARDLNGVNPLVALGGSIFALGAAAILWYGTNQLAAFFSLHQVPDTAPYFIIRSTSLVRNIAMGIISLASGFSGVVGLGIFLLSVRVAYGVMTGELDPTPIVQNQAEKVDTPNIWDLMLNKKPGRGGRK
jgi:hypothetical protein